MKVLEELSNKQCRLLVDQYINGLLVRVTGGSDEYRTLHYECFNYVIDYIILGGGGFPTEFEYERDGLNRVYTYNEIKSMLFCVWDSLLFINDIIVDNKE